MDDFVKRKDVIEAFDDSRVERNYGDVDPDSVIHVIKTIPAAEVRPVMKATWIIKEMQALFPGMDEHPVFVCSECGYQIYDLLDNVKEQHHFCSNCGADMRGNNG